MTLIHDETSKARIIATALVTVFMWLALSTEANAHGGGTDTYGCHNQTSTGTYHCHAGAYNGQSYSSKDAFLAFINSTPTPPANTNPTVSIPAGSRTISDTDGNSGESFTISATATDTDGTIFSTAWIVNGVTLATGTAATLSLSDGSHIVTFKATDNSGASSSTFVTITVAAPHSNSLVYNRDDYLPDWADADGDCISTRHEVLIIESAIPVTMSPSGCTVVAGLWQDPLTGMTFTNPSDVDIDHHVPLAEAHRSGADLWPVAQKQAFANDLLLSYTLIAVDDGTNSSKGDRDPAEWLPPNTSYHCEYVRNWVEVKNAYGLSYDLAERSAIESILGGDVSLGARSSISGDSTNSGTTTAKFGLGVRRSSECGYSSTVSINESFELSLSILPRLADLNRPLDIIVVAAIGSSLFSVSPTGDLVPFSGNLAELVAFNQDMNLKQSYSVTLFSGSFSTPLGADIFIAYRTEAGELIYTPSSFPVIVR